MSLLIAQYTVVKPTSIHFNEPGAGEIVKSYYQQFTESSAPRLIPFNRRVIPVQPGSKVEVTYGARTTLSVPVRFEVVLKVDGGKELYRYLTCGPMTLKIDGQSYEGELLAYDQVYPGIAADIWSLKATNDLALLIGGSQLAK